MVLFARSAAHIIALEKVFSGVAQRGPLIALALS
jgi:hypothetical protein